MCETNKRTFGVELEGYTSNNIRGGYINNWKFIQDGSLEDGDEYEECWACDGRGERHEECSHCDGRGNHDCEDCNGEGEVDCDKCDGTNERECYDCSGEGGWHDDDGEGGQEWVECSGCGGDGSFDCDECDRYGQVSCYSCSGDGHNECSRCDGEGYIEEECSHCGGSGGYGGESDEYGVECVSGILTEGDTESIDDVFRYIRDNDWNTREDCGTHVHVGADDYTPADLAKLSILTNIVEPIIYGSLSTDRIEGTYAKKIQRDMVDYFILKGDEITLDQVHYAYYGFARNGNGFQKYEHQRYYGLNLHSYFYRKTLEFRYFDGTECAEETKGWVDLCIKLVDFAKHTTFEQLKVIGQDIYNTDGQQLKTQKIKLLLGLEYNLIQTNSNSYGIAMTNLAGYFIGTTVDTNISLAM